MHVVEDLAQKNAAWTPADRPPPTAPSQPPPSTSASQRDLDDPGIEQGVDRSGIALRKRKLFAQPVTGGGPMSDASSQEDMSSDESVA